jgi:hypothetical protein
MRPFAVLVFCANAHRQTTDTVPKLEIAGSPDVFRRVFSIPIP